MEKKMLELSENIHPEDDATVILALVLNIHINTFLTRCIQMWTQRM